VVDTRNVTIDTTDGEYHVEWARLEDEAASDLAEDEVAGDTGPLEYRFDVTAGAACSEETSGPLWLTNTVHINLLNEADQLFQDEEMELTLTSSDGKTVRTRTTNGRATFEDVVIGPLVLDVKPVEK
jgi:hypothetical protein